VVSLGTEPDTWATATGKEADLPTIYRYRKNRPNARLSDEILSHALRVVWEYDGSSRNGMPEAAVNEAQIGFEDAIEPLCEGSLGCLVLVFSGNSRKEWLFYTPSPDMWAAKLTKLLARHPPYPLLIENWADPEWTTWQNFTRSVTDES